MHYRDSYRVDTISILWYPFEQELSPAMVFCGLYVGFDGIVQLHPDLEFT
jgi:hypothetical protein